MVAPDESDPFEGLISQLANLSQAISGGPVAVPEEVVGSAGGGVVKVHARTDLGFTRVEIDPKAVDPDDVALLEDLVLAAVRDAADQLRREAEDTLGQALGGALSGLMEAMAETGAEYEDEDDEDEDADADEGDAAGEAAAGAGQLPQAIHGAAEPDGSEDSVGDGTESGR